MNAAPTDPPAASERAGSVRIRAAQPHDAEAIAAIFNQAIGERVATFQTWPASPADFADRIAGTARSVVLVALVDGAVAAFAAVTGTSERPFYAGVGEYQVYVERSARGRGVGGALLEAVAGEARRRGYWKLIGKLFTTNAASIALARRAGFRDVGVHLRHGRLDGEWRDVLLVERQLDG